MNCVQTNQWNNRYFVQEKPDLGESVDGSRKNESKIGWIVQNIRVLREHISFPGFFYFSSIIGSNVNVRLPILFDKPFHQVEKVRRIKLEDALRTLDEIAVYYDRSALSQEAQPAQLDFQRIDVGRDTGAFHPKLIFLLVENKPQEDEEPDPKDVNLLVAALSANLTRTGWWESDLNANLKTDPMLNLRKRKTPTDR